MRGWDVGRVAEWLSPGGVKPGAEARTVCSVAGAENGWVDATSTGTGRGCSRSTSAGVFGCAGGVEGVRTFGAARACLVSSSCVRVPGERSLSRSARSCALAAAASTIAPAGSAKVQAIGNPTTPTRQPATAAMRRWRRRATRARRARERAIARATLRLALLGRLVSSKLTPAANEKFHRTSTSPKQP